MATSSAAQTPSRLDAAQEHLQAGEFAEAARLFEAEIAEDPPAAFAWNQLGYCRLSLGDAAGAIEAFQASAEYPNTRQTALYNLACAHSIVGSVEEGVGALQGAIRAGFSDYDLIESDTDLANLRDHPRFAEITARPVYQRHPDARAVSFASSEGHLIYAELYPAKPDPDDRSAPVILLFHQSGSNLAEYQLIAPRLTEMGFHCLSLDARGGGSSYGNTNRTVSEIVEAGGERGGGREAIRDFETALQWVRREGFSGPVAVWGSSYSAGRVFQLLADHPEEIACGLAFSPGRGYTREGENGEPSWAKRATKPVLVTCPEHEYDDSWQARADEIASADRVVFVQAGGTHGSSTLRPDRNPEGWESNWGPVTAFLERHLGDPAVAKGAMH